MAVHKGKLGRKFLNLTTDTPKLPGIFLVGGGGYSDGSYGGGSGHPKYFEVLEWFLPCYPELGLIRWTSPRTTPGCTWTWATMDT